MARPYAYPRCRHRGSEATPLKPWSQRRAALIALLNESSLVVNRIHCRQTNHNTPASRDLRRLIAEGFAALSGKRKHGGGASYRYLELTNLGRAQVKACAPVHIPQPYAKRRAELSALSSEPQEPASAWD